MLAIALNFLLSVGLIGFSRGEVEDGVNELLVAFRCGRPAMYTTREGWTADNMTDCLRDADDILRYCLKMYPLLEVNNFVKLNHKVTVGKKWCNFAGEKCDQDYKVEPYQCLPSVEVVNNWPAQIGEPESPTPSTESDSDSDDVESQPENEHSRYIRVRAELQKHHDGELAKIMDAWDEAQREVEKMRGKDPDLAEKLEKKITARFQKTINSLEEREDSEKKRIDSLHDQKVQRELNDKKKEAMEVYMAVLSKKEDATLQNVFRVLRHYVRMEQKDRMHIINHYLHLQETDPAAAESSRSLVAEHLKTIRMRLERAVRMLNRVPEFRAEIKKRIDDVLDEYQQFDKVETLIITVSSSDGKNQNKMQKKNKDAQVVETGNGKDNTQTDIDAGAEDDDEDDDEVEMEQADRDDSRELLKPEPVVIEDPRDDDVIQKPAVHPSHLDTSNLQLNEKQSLKWKNDISYDFGPIVGITIVSIFLITVVILGVFVWRRHVEVRGRRRGGMKENAALLASSEQAHVANMQANGYENPTYKYFEARAII